MGDSDFDFVHVYTKTVPVVTTISGSTSVMLHVQEAHYDTEGSTG